MAGRHGVTWRAAIEKGVTFLAGRHGGPPWRLVQFGRQIGHFPNSPPLRPMDDAFASASIAAAARAARRAAHDERLLRSGRGGVVRLVRPDLGTVVPALGDPDLMDPSAPVLLGHDADVLRREFPRPGGPWSVQVQRRGRSAVPARATRFARLRWYVERVNPQLRQALAAAERRRVAAANELRRPLNLPVLRPRQRNEPPNIGRAARHVYERSREYVRAAQRHDQEAVARAIALDAQRIARLGPHQRRQYGERMRALADAAAAFAADEERLRRRREAIADAEAAFAAEH